MPGCMARGRFLNSLDVWPLNSATRFKSFCISFAYTYVHAIYPAIHQVCPHSTAGVMRTATGGRANFLAMLPGAAAAFPPCFHTFSRYMLLTHIPVLSDRGAGVGQPEEDFDVPLLLRVPPHPRHEALHAAVLRGDHSGLGLKQRRRYRKIIIASDRLARRSTLISSPSSTHSTFPPSFLPFPNSSDPLP